MQTRLHTSLHPPAIPKVNSLQGSPKTLSIRARGLSAAWKVGCLGTWIWSAGCLRHQCRDLALGPGNHWDFSSLSQHNCTHPAESAEKCLLGRKSCGSREERGEVKGSAQRLRYCSQGTLCKKAQTEELMFISQLF